MFWVVLEVSAWVLPRINPLWPTRKDSDQENKRSWQGYGIVLLEVRLRYLLAAFEVCGAFEVRLRFLQCFFRTFTSF